MRYLSSGVYMTLFQWIFAVVKSAVETGYWDIVGEFFASHCDAHYVCFFLLGADVVYDAAVGDLSVSGNFMSVDK